MAYSKVAYDGHTLIDLTQDTAVESDVADGKWFHKSNGERVQGTSGKVIVQGSDSSAFLIRPTAGETLAPLDCDRKSVLKKLGNTVGVNQLVQNGDFAEGKANWNGNNSFVVNSKIASFTATSRYDGPYQILAVPKIAGHTYYLHAKVKATTATNQIQVLCQGNGTALSIYTKATTDWQTVEIIGSATLDFSRVTIRDNRTSGWDNIQFTNFMLIDLTLWFGSNDRIPADLLSHPENWGRYYAGSLAYAAGYLGNADGSILTSIGRNCWDGEWEAGSINSTTGANEGGASAWRTVNYIPVSPNAQYYFHYTSQQNLKGRFYDAAKNYIGFKDGNGNNLFSNRAILIPPSAHFVRFCPADSEVPGHTITVSRYYSGESGYDEDYDYSVLAEVDTGSEVLHGDGTPEHSDEKLPSGEITRKRARVDMGTLVYYKYSGEGYGTLFYTDSLIGQIKHASDDEVYTICSKFASYPNEYQAPEGDPYFLPDGALRVRTSDGRIYIHAEAYSTYDGTQFGTAMSGAMLEYELVTPTTEQGTAFTGLQKVDGHGIEMVTGGTTGIPVPFTAQYLKTINATPTDTIVITENGSHDVSMYAGALVDVSGGGTPSLQSKTVNLDSNAPSTVYPGTGYNGLSSVAFNTAGINAANIKAGTSVCGVQGTYAALTYDRQTVTPPIGIATPVSFTTGWKPDVLVFDWSEEDVNDPSIIDYYRKALTADGSIESGNDTVTFTSTGYTVMMDGTYWNDSPERFGTMTITAIKLS